MSPEEAQEFLRTHHRAVMATFRADGRPALTPVLAVADAEGRVVVSTRETAMKVRHLRRDPRVALCVFTDRFWGDWAQLEGTAEIVSLPEAMELLVDYYRRAAGEHGDWADYRAAMERDQRCLIRFELTRAGPDQAG